MEITPAALISAFGFLSVAGPRLSSWFASRRTVPPMADAPQPPALTSAPEPDDGELHNAFLCLRDVLPYVQGSHIAMPMADRTVRVVSHRGPVLVVPWIDVTDPGAAGAVRAALHEAGIRARVEEDDLGDVQIAMVLSTAADLTALAERLATWLSPSEHLARELVGTLREAKFSHPGHGTVSPERICEVKLSLDDVRKVRAVLGEPDEELTAWGAELYQLAQEFGALLSRVLGGEITTTAYPARQDDRGAWLDELLVVDWLSLDQADRLISALTLKKAGRP